MIPPFEHLRNEFGSQMPDDLLTRDEDDILAFFSEDEMDDYEFKQTQSLFEGTGSKRPSEMASDFSMNILTSFSPISKPISDNNLNPRQTSIFDLGHSLGGAKSVSTGSASGLQSDNEERSMSDDYNALGGHGFLTRTDTKRDAFGNTIRDINPDWVNFDDDDNDDDGFNGPFNNFEENSRLDDIFASTGDSQSQKMKVSERIKGGLGSLAKKAKNVANKKMKRRSSIDAFGIDDANPIQPQSQPQQAQKMKPPIKAHNKADFDALNFSADEDKKRYSSNGYHKLKKQ